MTTVNIHDVRANSINNIRQNYLKQNIFLPLYELSTLSILSFNTSDLFLSHSTMWYRTYFSPVYTPSNRYLLLLREKKIQHPGSVARNSSRVF